MIRSLPAPQRWLDTWPLELGTILILAIGLRLAFLSVDVPVFLTTDSLTYALPASQLAHGQGFDLSLRRTPGYPLFLSALWATFGHEALPVVYAQHLLGVATAVLTWLLGRLAYGRLAGLLGGLAVALSGPQIIYEHYLMTETLFTLLLVLAMLALLLAVRGSEGQPSSLLVGSPASMGWFLLTGSLFGLCALTRPIGQILPVLVPVGVLLSGPAWRPSKARLGLATRATLVALVGFGLVLLPWMVRNRLVGGELTGSSALGKTLFGRITRHDDGLRFDLPAAGPIETDQRRAEARALARQTAQTDDSRGSLLHERLRREFGYTETQAYNLMRDVAVDVLLAQPDFYVRSSLGHIMTLFRGTEESLRTHLARLANNRLRNDWLGWSELAPLLPTPVPPEVRWESLGRASWAVQRYEPSNDALNLGLRLFFLVGLVVSALRRVWRPALTLPFLVVIVLTLSAFLDGPVARFRYPLDPFIALTAGAGLTALVALAQLLLLARPHRPRPRLGRPTPDPASPESPAAGPA